MNAKEQRTQQAVNTLKGMIERGAIFPTSTIYSQRVGGTLDNSRYRLLIFAPGKEPGETIRINLSPILSDLSGGHWKYNAKHAALVIFDPIEAIRLLSNLLYLRPDAFYKDILQ